ncbi:hypothetical protein CYMTET_11329 [Cymbomonas tetramitiformis]|uniref:MIR domain-containing protein n=1 Tax=Cymbomonas tetramitiformis TaxID=36881 RepID=A0AAE0GMP6_9CHLO|nr:hypothetical protein CYMTET_11329 [Cymbomonas tetramitiformis]
MYCTFPRISVWRPSLRNFLQPTGQIGVKLFDFVNTDIMDNIDDENEKESTLRYGDYITLRGLLTHGVLSAEGMLDVAVHMVSDPQRYDNCVFQVRNSNQYSASRELAEFHEQQEEARDAKATEGTSGDVEVSAKFRLALERGRDNEKKLNDSYFEQKKGAKIFYGDNVQLLHVNSGKYITVNSTQVAENERENLRVYLDPDGSQFSSLRVEPRYKIDRIGNPVLSDSQVFLRVAARVNEYLRVSDRDVAAKEREVNCSLERTPYKLCLYDDVSQTTEETAQVLSAGDIIYLQDPESDSQLRLLQDIEGERLVGGDIHAHEARDAYLDPNVEKGKINSNALFFVEKEDSSAGGKMVWREELYCLRHLNTGRYLSVRAAHVPVNSLADGDAFRSKNKVFARCISSYDQKKVEQGIPESTCMSTTFRFLPLYVQEGQENALEERFVTNNSAIQLENMNEDNGENNFMARGDRERVAENFLLRLPAHSERENSLSLLIMRVPHDIARDTLMGLSSKIRLRDFCKDLKTSNFGGIRRKVADTASTLTQVMAFVNQRPLTMTSYQLERLDMDGDLEQDEQRQILLQEQGVLDAILDVMQILGNAKAPTVSRPNTGEKEQRASRISNTPVVHLVNDKLPATEISLTLPHEMLLEMKQSLCSLAFRVLYYSVHLNPVNQMHVANKLLVFISYVTKEPASTRCITEMLGTNRELQESRVGRRGVATFVNMIRDSDMNSTLLNLLKSVCSCLGRGVDNNQGAVCQLLLEGAPELLIHVRMDKSGPRTPWALPGHSNLYTPGDHSLVAGYDLVDNGMPQVYLSWETQVPDLGCLALFNAQMVSVVDATRVLKPLTNGSLKSMSEKNSKREKIQSFLIAMLNLGSEMCLDRNYNSIRALYTLFGGGRTRSAFIKGQENLTEIQDSADECASSMPANQLEAYEALVAMLADVNLPNVLRASVVRLFINMFVDCAPQTSQHVPRLTRSWNDVEDQGKATSLPSVPAKRQHFFALVQAIISDHLHSLGGSCGNVLTNSLLNLLLALMRFRYYTTTEQLQDVVLPLLECIDRRGKDRRQTRLVTPPELGIARSYSKANVSKVVPAVELDGSPQNPGKGGADGALISPREEADLKVPMDIVTKPPCVAAMLSEDGRCAMAMGLVVALDGVWQRCSLRMAVRRGDGALVPAGLWGPEGVGWRWGLWRAVGALCGRGVMVLVITSIAVGVVTIINPSLDKNTGLYAFELTVTSIFVAEISLRFYCWMHVYRDALSFFRNPVNLVDALVVIMDVTFAIVNSAGGQFAKALRAVRIIRMVRASRVASRMVRNLQLNKAEKKSEYIAPDRYTRTPQHQTDTMVAMAEVIMYTNKMWRDYNLSKLMAGFKKWMSVNGEGKTPRAYFEEVISQGMIKMEQEQGDLDMVLLDLCMYDDQRVVQQALHCIANFSNMRVHLLRDFERVQLLTREKEMRQKQELELNVLTVRQLAETFELWEGLESAADVAKLSEMKEKLDAMIQACRVLNDKVGLYDGIYKADVHVQNMLTNLGLFEAAMTVLGLAAELDDEDAESEEKGGGGEEPSEGKISAAKEQAVMDILGLSCRLLCSWMYLNDQNQKIAFKELSTYFDLLDLGPEVGSARVITEIFRDNVDLIPQFPPPRIHDLVKKMAMQTMTASTENIEGKMRYPHPDLICIFDTITHSGMRGFLDNQLHVMKEFTRGETVASGLLFLGGTVDSEEYGYREKLCKEAELQQNTDAEDPDRENLPPDLIYNAALLDMLAGCAVGRVSITIIEVKLQTVYPCEDQLFALLSPRLPLAAKVPLANFFLQACIDVQISVPSLSTDVLLWRWLKSFPEQLNLARSVLQSICADLQATKGSSATTSGVKLNDRRQLQYAFLCLEVINYFMQREGRTIALSLALPDPDSWLSITKQKRDAAADPKRRAFLASAPQGIKPPATLGGIPEGVSLEADGELPPDVDMDDLEEDTATWMVTLMTEMYEATEALYDMDKSLKSGLLTVSQKRLLFQALDALGGTEARLGDRFSLRKEKTLANNASLEAEFSAQEEEQDQQTPDHVFSGISKFRDELSNDKQITEQGHMDNMAIREIIEFLPSLNDNIAPTDDLALLDLRYELLLRKLVEHASSTLSVIHEGSKKTVHADALETNIWMVKLFRNMIEAKWEMTIEDRDEDGGQAEDEKGGAVQLALNEAGVTALCLDMIAPGVDEALVMEAVKCLIALLFREGGNSVIQTTMNEHLSEGSSELFFVLCRSYIMRLKDYYKFVDEEFRMEGRLPEEDDIPDITLLLRLLQLMSEGHFLPNQDIMREQPHNRTNINLLEHMTAFVQLVSRFQCRVNSVGSTHMCSLILEVIQGPCKANQVYFALETELIETLNRMLRATPTRDCEDDHEDSLKELVLSIFQGLLEGQTQDTGSNVYDRVLSVLHFDVLHMLALGTANGADLDVLSPIFSMTTTQTESLVLMQMLLNYRPSLRDLLGPRRCAEMDDLLGKGVDVQDDVKPTVASVEVVWNGVLQRRFFHVPEICHDLSEASKAAFVEMVDRSSQESKLSDFIVQARDMYLEILHQQRLKSWHVARLFSRQNQNRSTWMGFLLCCTINSLLLTYESKGYCKEGKAGVRNGELPVMHSEIRNIDFAGYDHDHHSQIHCVYLSDEVENLKARGNSPPYSLARAFLDPLTVYYFWYQVMAVMAVYKSDLFSTFLLLDIIVKNSTTRAVVRAVYVPRKQLSMTMLLGVFVIYIFSAHNFFLFRDEFNHSHDGAMFDCQSMWRCLKSHLSYGLRMGGGIGDIMTHELDERILFDLGFFLVVLIVMMNIIFGIIIDTFSEIRGQKIERLKDTYERCFICGIEKQEFDRLSESGLTGFSDHYHTEHNMWHYFYFMVFIWEQDKDDDDGLEQYVRTNIDIGDISWFPIGKAIILTGLLNDENQDLLNAIFDNVKDMKSATNVQIAQLQNQMSRMQERIRQLGGMVLGSAAGKDGSDLIGAMQNLRKPQGGPGSIYASSIPHAS